MEFDLTIDLTLWSYAGLQDLDNLVETERRAWPDDGASETRKLWHLCIRRELIRRDREREGA